MLHIFFFYTVKQSIIGMATLFFTEAEILLYVLLGCNMSVHTASYLVAQLGKIDCYVVCVCASPRRSCFHAYEIRALENLEWYYILHPFSGRNVPGCYTLAVSEALPEDLQNLCEDERVPYVPPKRV